MPPVFLNPLDKNTFKEFWFKQDGLMNLEWRANFKHSLNNDIEQWYDYFDKWVCVDEHYNDYYKVNASKFWVQRQISSVEELQVIEQYRWKGIDILEIKEEYADLLFDKVKEISLPIRRIDILLTKKSFDYDYWYSLKHIEINIITNDDDDSYYSKDEMELQVDSQPEPYLEDGKLYHVLSGFLTWSDGWYIEDYFIGKMSTPFELIKSLLNTKIQIYSNYYKDILNDNLYKKYFKWVSEHVGVLYMGIIPAIMLPEYTTFSKKMLENDFEMVDSDGVLFYKPKNYTIDRLRLLCYIM